MNTANHREEALKNLKIMSEQINELKMQAVESTLKDQYAELIGHMEKIRKEVRSQFDQADQTRDYDWSGFDKTIYKNARAFDRAYKEAGTMFDGTYSSRP